MQDLIDNLRTEVADISHRIEVLSRYSDIKENTTRWGRHYYSSRSVNDKATNCDIQHNCGCCPDSPVEVWPYIVDDGVKIYTEKPYFVVGEKNVYGLGEYPYVGWKEKLVNAGIRSEIIEKVESYFAKNSHFSENPEIGVDEDEIE